MRRTRTGWFLPAVPGLLALITATCLLGTPAGAGGQVPRDPVVEGKVLAGFGRRKHPRFDTYTIHNGLEIEAAPGTPVRAVHEGTVVFADRFRGYGLLVVVDHGGKRHSLYGHLGEAAVAPGQPVAAGAVLGTAGDGGGEGPGLYFEMRYQGRAEDPADWLKRP